ncbi:MAG: ComEA family DNA-binding protein [Anaerolineales bacterium]|nr:ComEA family DNA-binding protein [Anaerolineales bacterium]
MRTGWAIAFGVLVGLLSAGVILLTGSQPRGEPVRLIPLTPSPLTVHVNGAVRSPGVYYLTAGSRVQDALLAAGGLLPSAEQGYLNQAAPLHDGEMISVPTVLPAHARTPLPTPSPFVKETDVPYPTSTRWLIDLNTATQAELESLPGIGPVLSRRIIAYRNAYGPFLTVEDLLKVYGIKPETFELIRDLITVGNPP